MNSSRLDGVTILLYIGILTFAAIVIAVDILRANDGQVFQVMCSVLSGFMGAFLARITPPKHMEDKPDAKVPGKEAEETVPK